MLAAVLVAAVLATAPPASANPPGHANPRLYVPHYNNDEIGGFEVGGDGGPFPIAGSPFDGGSGGLIALAFTPEGSRAAAAFLFNGAAQGLSVTPHGSVALAGSAIASPSATSVAVSPDGHFAYTPTRTFGATPGVGIVRYSIGDGGALTSVGSSPSPNDYYGIAVTPDGRFLYASGLNGIDRYAIALDGSLTGPTAVPSSIPAHKLAVSPDGRFLFAGGYFGQGVASYAIASDGALTENGGRAPTDTASVEYIAVAPDGRHIYLSAPNHGGIVTATVAEDGDLTELATTPTGGSPGAVTVSPDGRYLYFTDDYAQVILGVASIGADGIPTVLDDLSTPWSSGSTPTPIVIQPRPTPVASLAAPRVGSGRAVSFDASDSQRAARYDWSFGDGTTLANGGPSPVHRYPRPGTYAVRVTVTDGGGCSTRQIYTGQSTSCPGGSSASLGIDVGVPAEPAPPTVPSSAADDLEPALRLRRLSLSRKRLAVGRGTTFRYSLSGPARVRFTIQRRLAGRRVGRHCRPPTRANRGREECRRLRLVGAVTTNATAGRNATEFGGRLGGRALRPGHYRVRAVATSAGGRPAVPRAVGFTVVARD